MRTRRDETKQADAHLALGVTERLEPLLESPLTLGESDGFFQAYIEQMFEQISWRIKMG